MDDNPINSDLLPSDEDVSFYREHGWYVSPRILSEQMIGEALAGVNRLYAGQADRELPAVCSHFDWSPEQGDVLRMTAYASLRCEAIKRLVGTPIIAAIAAKLAGTLEIRLFRDHLIYKPRVTHCDRARVGWHLDRAYWLTCTSEEMLTAWVPLQDCDARMGSITMLDRSNHWAEDLDLRTSNEQDMQALMERINPSGPAASEVSMALAKGQVSFHHCRTIHGSHDNVSDRPRVAIAIHMQDGENHYRPYTLPTGKPFVHLNDLVCRQTEAGEPDYSDPDVCPVLWRAT